MLHVTIKHLLGMTRRHVLRGASEESHEHDGAQQRLSSSFRYTDHTILISKRNLT